MNRKNTEEVEHDGADAGAQDAEDKERDQRACRADREPLENEWEAHPGGARANDAHDGDLVAARQDGETNGVDHHSKHGKREADHDDQANDAQRTGDCDEAFSKRTAIKTLLIF